MAMLYTGHVTMTYPDYIDTATGKTLVCVPGQSYNILPASGHTASAGAATPTDGRFSASSGREEVLEEGLPENEIISSFADDGDASLDHNVSELPVGK